MSKIEHISSPGLDLIKKYEGFRSKPYRCPAGVPTIGYGTIFYPNGTRVSMTDEPISKATAEWILKENVQAFEYAVDAATRDDINQNQFDALVSFAYNVGINAFKRSTLLKYINRNPNDARIKAQFLRWKHANGRVLQGLLKRRQEEANLYFTKPKP